MVYGYKKSHYNYSSRWKVDCDYLSKLSVEELEYMARFLKEYYEGKTFQDKNLIEDKRESYNRQNASQRCSMIKFYDSLVPIETLTVSFVEPDIIFGGNQWEEEDLKK